MPRQETHITPIPTQWIGPLTISGNAVNDTVRVPLATYETPLWPSTARGAKVAEHCGGVRCTLIDDRMARSIRSQRRRGMVISAMIFLPRPRMPFTALAFWSVQ